MKSYLKFLSRNKLYTAIEAVGLIVGLADPQSRPDESGSGTEERLIWLHKHT